MAKRKTKAKARRTKRATGKSAARKRARKVSSSTKAAKQIRSSSRRKGAQRTRAIKPSSAPSVETIVVDVIEEPVPGVITVTEFEETDIRDVNREEE